MARYTGPKNRLSRREGFDLFGKGAKLRRIDSKPGMSTKMSKMSEYGKQLRAKQRTKRLYGILERQFRKYVSEASKSPGKIGDSLATILESRLDNVIYRLGFAKTRPAARQIVSHGHVQVNNKRMSIPSYQVKENDVIKLDNKILQSPNIAEYLETKVTVPIWIQRDGSEGKMINRPSIKDLDEAVSIRDIVEYYAR